MTEAEIDELRAGWSGVQRDGEVGTFLGCTIHVDALVLHVETDAGRVMWPAEECEAIR